MSNSAGSSSELVAGLESMLSAHRRGSRCFTPHGLAQIEKLLADVPADGQLIWNRQSRRLCLGQRLIREFARMAPGQMAVLDALQAGGWTADGVANPFRHLGATATRRLHYTVTNLNRRLRGRAIRFREDGTRVWCEVRQRKYA